MELITFDSFSQVEKLSFKRKIDISKNCSNATWEETELEDILMDSLYNAIDEFIEVDVYTNKRILAYVDSLKAIGSLVVDTFDLQYYTINFTRGSSLCQLQAANLPDKNKINRKTLYHIMEFKEYIYKERKIPFQLISSISYDLNYVISKHKYYINYDLKINDFVDIKIINKNFVQIR